MQRNDCVVAALGGSGQYNDLLLAYYQANGATSDNLVDAEYEFLIANGATSEFHRNDMWFEILRLWGYVGALSDMMYQFWCDEGGIPGVAIDSITWITDPIDIGNEAACSFTMYYDFDKIGGYDYTATISGGTGTDIVREGELTAPGGEMIIGLLDCSVFDTGLVTATVTIAVAGIDGPAVVQTVDKIS